MDDVRLPDLEVIRRYSIAVRREHAPADEVIEALRADLQRLSGRGQRAAERAAPEEDEAPVSAPARRPATSARTTSARSAPARRTAPSRSTASRKRAKPARKTYRSR